MWAGLEARVNAANLSPLDLLDHLGASAVCDVNAAAGSLRNEKDAMHGLDLREDRTRSNIVRQLREPGRAGRLPEAVCDGGILAVHD